MNIIDQKINHLRYLYTKRVNHNLEIETAIANVKKPIKEKERQFEQESRPLYEKGNNIKLKYVVFGSIFGGTSGYLAFSLIQKLLEAVILPKLAALFVSVGTTACVAGCAALPCILSLKLLEKNKKYKKCIDEIENLQSDLTLELSEFKNELQRLENHLMVSKTETERIEMLLTDFEREQKRLKEIAYNQVLERIKDNAWQHYIVSMEDIQRLDDLQQTSKKKKKIYQ